MRSQIDRLMKNSSSPKKLPNGRLSVIGRSGTAPATAATRRTIATTSSVVHPPAFVRRRGRTSRAGKQPTSRRRTRRSAATARRRRRCRCRRASRCAQALHAHAAPKTTQLVLAGDRRQRETARRLARLPPPATRGARRRSAATRARCATAAGVCSRTSSAVHAVADDLARAGRAGRDDRHAARHRLDEHVAEPFVARGQREHVGARDVLPGIPLKSAQHARRRRGRAAAICCAARLPDRPGRG